MFKKNLLGLAVLASLGTAVYSGYKYLNIPAPKVQHNFLLISDMHVISPYNTKSSYGDVPMALFNQFISKTDSVLNHTASLDFILYTGDLPAHAGLGPISPVNIPGHDSDLTTALRGLQMLAANHPDIPLFYLPGNNDSEKGDYFPFGTSKSSAFKLVNDIKNPFPALNVNRGAKKIPCLIDMGDTALCYYSAYPAEGLRLIALNTVVYTGEFCRWVKGANDIAEKEMQWLNAQLEDAKNKNEKVYIAMHVPPRYIDYHTYMPDSYGWTNKITPKKKGMKSYDQWFFSLHSQYKDNCIEAVFYGHTHMDELYLLQESSKKLGVAISCPGICYAHGNNSGFKTVTFDSASKSPLDFTTYYTNPTGVGNWGTKSYTFSSTFGSDPLKQTIFERLSVMTDPEIAKAVKNIYKVNPR